MHQVEYKLPAHASASPEAMDLLQHILVEDPTHRYSLQDMQNHPWSVLSVWHSIGSMSSLLRDNWVLGMPCTASFLLCIFGCCLGAVSKEGTAHAGL